MPSSRRQKHTFWQDFRLFFLRGLAILLPSVLTLWILVMAYQFVQRNVAEPINGGIRAVVLQAAPVFFSEQDLPEWFAVTDEQVRSVRESRAGRGERLLSDAELRSVIRTRNFRDWWNEHFYLRAIGLIVAIVLIYLAGLLLGGFIGRRLYMRVEEFLTRVPIFKQVYPHVKQVVEFLFAEDTRSHFMRVVLVEYPRKGIWTVGLMTGRSMKSIEGAAKDRCITIFIPSSPTPFTGYTITVPEKESIDLPISVEEALRFVVTGGVLVPPDEAITKEQLAELARRQAQAGPGALAGEQSPVMIDREADSETDESEQEKRPEAAGDRSQRGE